MKMPQTVRRNTNRGNRLLSKMPRGRVGWIKITLEEIRKLKCDVENPEGANQLNVLQLSGKIVFQRHDDDDVEETLLGGKKTRKGWLLQEQNNCEQAFQQLPCICP